MANPITAAAKAIGDFARDRMLIEYGGRPDNLINATATGTQLILRPSLNIENTGLDEFFSTVPDAQVYITAFAPVANPVRVHDLSCGGMKRALSGRPYAYRKKPLIEVDVTVIGNSVDYYRLMMLEAFYGGYSHKGEAITGIPLLEMQIVPASAPGLALTFEDGMMVQGNPGVTITNNPRIDDKTFSFQFGKVTPPSESDQKYGMGTLSSMIGFDVGI